MRLSEAFQQKLSYAAFTAWPLLHTLSQLTTSSARQLISANGAGSKLEPSCLAIKDGWDLRICSSKTLSVRRKTKQPSLTVVLGLLQAVPFSGNSRLGMRRIANQF